MAAESWYTDYEDEEQQQDTSEEDTNRKKVPSHHVLGEMVKERMSYDLSTFVSNSLQSSQS